MVKRIITYFFVAAALAVQLVSCDDGMTYAERMEKEREIIDAFLADSGFYYVESFPTDSFRDSKEFMLFPDGMYMRVEDFGSGRAFKSGDMVTVRFTEVNLSNQLTVSNIAARFSDTFRYQVSGSTQAGIFVKNEGGDDAFMVSLYSSTAVPSGWLLPLEYVRDGAYVRLIVPHKLGQTDATYYVYPCYYEIYYGIAKK